MAASSSIMSRRRILAAAASLPAIGVVARAASATNPAPRVRLEPQNPASALRAIRKVLFADHEELVCWWMKGLKYGLIDNRATALYGMEIATFLRCRNIAADRFEVTSLEIVYYTDLASGELLERWQNPYTGEWQDMKYVPVGPTQVTYAPEGPIAPHSLPGARIEATHHMGPVTVVNDDVWIRNDTDASVTRDTGTDSKPFLVHDWATYHARLRDIEDPAIRSAPADVSFIDITGWPRNMNMGDRPGTRMSRAAGRKVDHRDEMPEGFLRLLRRVHPEIHRDPAAALQARTNRFER